MMADTKIINGEKFERVGDAFLMFNSAGKLMALGGERQTNTTQEIMRRVNLHDELVAALTDALEDVEAVACDRGDGGPEPHKRYSRWQEITALLAKAKGE